MTASDRKYRLTRYGPGDYLMLGNDGTTMFRLVAVTEGPSSGLMDWPRDKRVWTVWRWHVPWGPGAPYLARDVADDGWVLVETLLPTRRAAEAVAVDLSGRPDMNNDEDS